MPSSMMRFACCGCGKRELFDSGRSFEEQGWIERKIVHSHVGPILAWYCSVQCFESWQRKKGSG